jgi:hypothetical protein
MTTLDLDAQRKNIGMRYNGRLYVKSVLVLLKSEAVQRQLRAAEKLKLKSGYPM